MSAFGNGFAGESRRIARTPLRLLLLSAPFLAWLVCLSVYALRVPRALHAGVVDLDRTTLSRTLVRDLQSSPSLELSHYASTDDLTAALRRGEIRCGVVVPRGTDEAVREGRTARIPLLRDATRSLPTTQAWQVVNTVVATEAARLSAARLMRAGLPASAARESALPLRLDARPLGNPWMDYLRSFAPALLPMFLQLALMVAGASCAGGARLMPRAWNLGRVAAWMLPAVVLGTLAEMALADGIGAGLGAALATGLLCLASGLFGLGLGRIVRDPQKAVQVLLVFNTPAFLLSGFAFPEWAMPRAMEILTRPLPYSLWLDTALAVSGTTTGHLARGVLGLLGWIVLGALLDLVPVRRGKTKLGSGIRRTRVPFLAIPGVATLVFLGPPGYFALYGSVYAAKEETRVPVAVVASSPSDQARDLMRSLASHPRLDIHGALPDQARAELASGAVRAVVEIPRDLDLRLGRARSVSLPMLVHADRFLVASDLQRAVSEVLSDASARVRAERLSLGQNPTRARELAAPLLLDDRPLGNPHETYGDYMLPLIGLLIAHQLLLVAAGVVAAQRRSDGLSLRASLGQIGILWAWFSVAAGLWSWIGLAWFDVPVAPDLLAVVLAIPLGMAGAAGLGAVLGRLAGHPIWLLRLAAFTSYPLFFLSGASWPLEAMPASVRAAAWFNPLAPLLDATDRALRLSASVAEILPALGHALALAALWTTVAMVVGTLARRWFDRRPAAH
jgi:ABC-2 type transport system permease protein